MASFILLMNWTEQGIRNVEGWPERLAAAKQQIQAAGGQMDAAYLTMGIYDVVAILSGIDDTAMAKLAISLGRAGNVRTTTLRAYPEDEATQLVRGS